LQDKPDNMDAIRWDGYARLMSIAKTCPRRC